VGLRIIATDDLGADISGLLVSRDGAASIAVRKTDPLVRRRFTIAHEIGHFVLRHYMRRNELVHADEHAQVIEVRGFQDLTPEFRQPVRCEFIDASKLVREEAAKHQRPLFEDDVKLLAGQFKVSEQAMTIRLTTLGLL
jgi:Zn-dependent peptidase ImmA (M78 family)